MARIFHDAHVRRASERLSPNPIVLQIPGRDVVQPFADDDAFRRMIVMQTIAGDFADQPKVPASYRYKWLPNIRAWLGVEHRDDQQAFYWRVYVPVMQHVLAETEATARASAADDDLQRVASR